MKFKKGKPPSEAEPEPLPTFATAEELGISAEAREGANRCALCHDAILMRHAGAQCPDCATVLHRDCAAGTRRCPTLGCQARTRAFAPLAEGRAKDLRQGWSVFVVPAVLVVIVASIAFGLVGVPLLMEQRREAAAAEKKAQREVSAAAEREERFKKLVWVLASRESETKRRSAAGALQNYGSRAALPLARACLDSGNVRFAAAHSLARVDGSIELGLDVLAAALQNPNPTVRECAAFAFAEVGSRGASQRRALLKATTDESKPVRGWALNALWKIDPGGTVPMFVELLADPDVRSLCAARLAEAPPQYIEAIATALASPDMKVRWSAVEALKNRRDNAPEAVFPLARALEDEEKMIRYTAVTGLDTLGRLSAPAVNALAKALEDEYSMTRLYAAQALGKLGPDAQPAIEALAKALGDRDAQVRRAVVWSLRDLGPVARGAIPALERMRDSDRTDWMRELAVEALEAIRG
jgi:HEAT repeat protein